MTAPSTDALTVPEVMELLGISRTTLNRLRDRGELEEINPPTLAKRKAWKLLFSRADIERLNQRRMRRAS